MVAFTQNHDKLGPGRYFLSFISPLLLALWLSCGAATRGDARQVISLNGLWEIAEGRMAQAPEHFDHHVPVPGLADMAAPAFAGVGETNQLREAFWYRRTFRLEGPLPAVATLKIHKAAYGTRVYLNGTMVGDHLPSFTPGLFNVREGLRVGGKTNELLVRVGASRGAVPEAIPAGWDFEKVRYIPGLFDAVELILSGTPNIVRVQVAPDLTQPSIRIQTVVRNAGPPTTARLNFNVREARSGLMVSTLQSDPIALDGDAERTVKTLLPMHDCRFWSPEDPFLYELETNSGADSLSLRFGMREFHFDQPSGRAYLNGRPYFLRGSNVCIYRFFEDPLRGNLPWREDWVRRLHRKFKEMNWNALRYCIGFPPEAWYRVADEEGILIQDEFPIWHGTQWPAALKSDELVKEYTEWMQERWNHPCVILWDAQNESVTQETGKAIAAVRALDWSNRPWDNGWSPAQAPGDCFESHPYLFINPKFKLADLAHVSGVPQGNVIPNKGTNAIIINEYDWLWLNRDGTPTTLSRPVYQNLLGPDATPNQRRQLYARSLAALSEFWRCHRACAGVLHFCGLGYSRPGGQTSDHFTDLEQLSFEPEFERCVRDAFAPTGLMIDEWAEQLPAGQTRPFPVLIINDLYRAWEGTVRFRIIRHGTVVVEKSERCDVPALGNRRLVFAGAIPPEPGDYQLEAALLKPGEGSVRSMRDFKAVSAR